MNEYHGTVNVNFEISTSEGNMISGKQLQSFLHKGIVYTHISSLKAGLLLIIHDFTLSIETAQRLAAAYMKHYIH